MKNYPLFVIRVYVYVISKIPGVIISMKINHMISNLYKVEFSRWMNILLNINIWTCMSLNWSKIYIIQQKVTIGSQPIWCPKRFIELVLIKKYLVTRAKQDDYEFNKKCNKRHSKYHDKITDELNFYIMFEDQQNAWCKNTDWHQCSMGLYDYKDLKGILYNFSLR